MKIPLAKRNFPGWYKLNIQTVLKGIFRAGGGRTENFVEVTNPNPLSFKSSKKKKNHEARTPNQTRSWLVFNWILINFISQISIPTGQSYILPLLFPPFLRWPSPLFTVGKYFFFLYFLFCFWGANENRPARWLFSPWVWPEEGEWEKGGHHLRSRSLLL